MADEKPVLAYVVRWRDRGKEAHSNVVIIQPGKKADADNLVVELVRDVLRSGSGMGTDMEFTVTSTWILTPPEAGGSS